MKEKFKKDFTFIMLIAVIFILLIMNVVMIHKYDKLKQEMSSSAEVAEANYHPASESLAEKNYYPGRVYNDYDDMVFAFDAYLEHIGATKVQRYIYQTSVGVVNFELRFTFDGLDYVITTTGYSTDDYLYGTYTALTASNGDVIFGVPTNSCGELVMDSTSPFFMDRDVFDVLHVATDKESMLHQKLQAGTDESNCPFLGLGVAHYEKNVSSGEVIWHDDAGDMYEKKPDLHY
jgi:hypothetical protein